MTTFAEHLRPDTADGALARAYLAGDDEAFAALFRRYQPSLLRLLTARVHDHALAEDLAQEALARALRYLGSYDPRQPFWPWVRTIAERLASTELARRGAEVPVHELDTALVALPDKSDQVVTYSLVMECLAELQPRQRRALIMRYVEDRDPSDIAALFGLNRNALEQLLSRARKNFVREYRARSGAVVPGFATLVARLRRFLSDAASRLQVTGATPFSMAGDLAIGAAITVGGIGIATVFGGGDDTAYTASLTRPSAPTPYASYAGYDSGARSSADATAGTTLRPDLLTGTGDPRQARLTQPGAAPDGAAPGAEAGPAEPGGTTTDPGGGSSPDGGDGTSAPGTPGDDGSHTEPSAPGGTVPDDGVSVRHGNAGDTSTAVVVNDEATTAEVDDEDKGLDAIVRIERDMDEEGEVMTNAVWVKDPNNPDGEPIAGTRGTVTNYGNGFADDIPQVTLLGV